MTVSAQPRDHLLTRISAQVSRRIIARYREKLLWMLHVPEWAELLEQGLKILELPGPRKGISLQGALDSLAIENKYALILWALERYEGEFNSQCALSLCERFELSPTDDLESGETISVEQWLELRGKLVAAIKQAHLRYKHAQAVLFYEYQSLVEMTVNRIVFDPAKRPDAIQEGCLGLLQAIDKAEDSDRSLASYAQSWITRRIKNYLMQQRFAVHVPINLAAEALTWEQDRDTDIVSQSTKDKLTALVYERLCRPSVSLEDILEGDGGVSLSDIETDDPLESLIRKDLCDLVDCIIENLTEKQREVVALRYGINENERKLSRSELARLIGISHQQVSMREKRALLKIEEALKPYMDELYD